VVANHYNPDLMTAPADIVVNGAPAFHVNFANTFSWNQFWNLTIPVSADFHAGGSGQLSGELVADGAALPPGDGCGGWQVC
jgi:hypothetical protein